MYIFICIHINVCRCISEASLYLRPENLFMNVFIVIGVACPKNVVSICDFERKIEVYKSIDPNAE